MTTANDVLVAIMRGELDDDLDTIADAAQQRRKVAAKRFAATLKAGDRVKLTGIRPVGLNGATGTVKEVGRTRIGVVIDTEFSASAGRFAPQISVGLPLRVPNACVVRA